ncbi:MAG: hypothetical protein KKG76_08890 [Euryarchaeota archaeon]|nr:hypothetical protein [Euryarchaeota archaeon]MBU4138584.1 hypothetical protein [Euryarchaeota archaeon]
MSTDTDATVAEPPPETTAAMTQTQATIDTMGMGKVNRNDIAATLSLFFKFSKVLEIRIPKVRVNGRFEITVAGYYDFENLNMAVQDVMKYDGKAPGIYVTLNTVNPDLLARCCNRLKEKAELTTSDKDIKVRIFILVDIDPIRPAGISSTDQEHKAAIAKAYHIREYMAKRGWADPVVCDSGNGAGLLYSIELPNTDESTELVKKCLEAFDLLFGDEKIEIDTTVFNAARIVKLFGTTAKKGDNTKDRPNRVSSILQMPAEIRPVSLEQIQDLITILPAEEEPHPQSGDGFDILAWMKQYDITVTATKQWKGGTVYVLQECPFDTNHKYPDACIIQMNSGALVFKCFHNSCSGYDWKALRALKEPGRKQRIANIPGSKVASDPNVEFHRTDLGNARRLVQLVEGDARYCHPYKAWLVWNGKRWVEDKTGKMGRYAKEVIDSMYEEALKLDFESKKSLISYAMRCESAGRIRDIIELAQSEDGIPILPDDFDTNIWDFNVQNGTIDLTTGKVRPHNKNDHTTKISPVVYDPAAKCPRWLEFLDTIFRGNKNVIKYIQKQVGYAMTGSTREEDFSIHYGTGGNGKSKYSNQIAYVMGDYFIKAKVETIINSKHTQSGNAASGDVARLAGARLVMASEPDRGTELKEGMIKELTGRDPITARHLHQREFTFTPEFKFWLITNHKPNLKSQDNGLWRRIKLVPFEVTIPDKNIDLNLDIRLKEESSGILNWMIQGCLLWQIEGMAIPDEIKEATSEYKEEMDRLGEYFNLCCEIDKTGITPNRWLYNIYQAWCEVANLRPMSQIAFTQVMLERGYKKKSTNKGVVWIGLRLNHHCLETITKIENESGDGKSDGVMDMMVSSVNFLYTIPYGKNMNKPSQPSLPSLKPSVDNGSLGDEQTQMSDGSTITAPLLTTINLVHQAAQKWEQEHCTKITTYSLIGATFDLKPQFPDITTDDLANHLRRYAKIPASTDNNGNDDHPTDVKIKKCNPVQVSGQSTEVELWE